MTSQVIKESFIVLNLFCLLELIVFGLVIYLEMRSVEREVKLSLIIFLAHGGDVQVVALCVERLESILKFFEDGKERFIF